MRKKEKFVKSVVDKFNHKDIPLTLFATQLWSSMVKIFIFVHFLAQTNQNMTMKEWHKYYETPAPQRRDLYNVIR